jgi:PKHD-type hydroxylase
VRADAQRTLLYDLDNAVQALSGKLGRSDGSVVSLTGAYHNLLRMWAEA